MNKERIIKFLIMHILKEVDDCICELNRPCEPDLAIIRINLKTIEKYAQMIVEDKDE